MKNGESHYRRILLKLSGESFKGNNPGIIDPTVVSYVASEIKQILVLGIQVGVCVGGGNIWRGSEAESQGMDRATADYAGMLATMINAVTLQDMLERDFQVPTRTMTAIDTREIAEPYIRRRAIRHLERNRVVIFAAGTGNPFMTTDTAAALRAVEIEADLLLMAKNNVDGIYDSDPSTSKNAKKIDRITYIQAIEKRLQIMDTTALSLCMDNNLPMIVFDMFKKGNIQKIVQGEITGTLVTTT